VAPILLRGTRGLFDASGFVDTDEFRRYVGALDLQAAAKPRMVGTVREPPVEGIRARGFGTAGCRRMAFSSSSNGRSPWRAPFR